MYTHVDNSKIDLLHKNVVHWSMYSFFMKKIVFIFLHNTMSMAEAWLGGIGEYPPHPSGFTLEYQINVGLRLLNFEFFSQAYALIRYPTFINFPSHAGTSSTDIVNMLYKYVHMYYIITIQS